MTHEQAQEAGDQHEAPHVAIEPAEQHDQAEIGTKGKQQIVLVLHLHDLVFHQVRHARKIGLGSRVITQHPTQMREPQATLGRIGITIHIIDMRMMHTVSGRPDQDAVLHRHAAEDGIEHLQRRMRLVCAMRPQAVIASSDREFIEREEHQRPDPYGSTDRVVPQIERQHRDHGQGRQAQHQGGRPVDRRAGCFVHLLYSHGSHV